MELPIDTYETYSLAAFYSNLDLVEKYYVVAKSITQRNAYYRFGYGNFMNISLGGDYRIKVLKIKYGCVV